jgi:hypothetical protein
MCSVRYGMLNRRQRTLLRLGNEMSRGSDGRAAAMRTVLAIDEMLAHEVKPKLRGEVAKLDRMHMREHKRVLIDTIRDFLTRYPSVLAIGGRAWDALPMLHDLRLPSSIPVVLVAPEATRECRDRAHDLGVLSILPVDGSFSGAASALAVECRLAEAVRTGKLVRPLRPVVVVRSRRPAAPDLGRVQRLPIDRARRVLSLASGPDLPPKDA